MIVKAIYQDGVFKPVTPVDLTEGEWVDLEIVRSSPQRPRKVVSLQGIWREHARSEGDEDWVSETIAEIRRTSAEMFVTLFKKPPRCRSHRSAL